MSTNVSVIETTLVIINPDGVKRGLVAEIKQRYLDAGLVVVWENSELLLDESGVRDLYRNHEGKFYFEDLVFFMRTGPCVVLILDGEQAIEAVLKLNGVPSPARAAPETTLYYLFGAGGPFNTVHASDSPAAFSREMGIVLGR